MLVRYYSDHADVPDDIALPLLGKLMDEGFQLEITAAGTTQWAHRVSLDHFTIGITRLSKHELY